MTRSVALALIAALICVLTGCSDDHPRSTPSAPPAPGPIIGGQPQAPRDPLSAAQRRQAAVAVRRFLDGYLPYLYGRGPARRIAPVTPSVARTLRTGHARITPAQRRRHPRIAGLKVTGQTARSALVAVQVADGGPAPFQLTLTVERRDGRWTVSDLGDDG